MIHAMWVLFIYALLSLVVVAYVALGIFFLKWRNQYDGVYGLIECGVGLVLAFCATFGVKERNLDAGVMLAFYAAIGGVYVMVRGLDNLSKSKSKTRWICYLQSWVNYFVIPTPEPSVPVPTDVAGSIPPETSCDP